MSDSGSPPEFQWVEPAGPVASRESPRRRRWLWVIAAEVIVIVVVAAGIAVAHWWPADRGAHNDGGHGTQAAQPPPMGTPQDLLVAFPLTRQPLSQWQIGPTDLGLPAEAMLWTLLGSGDDKAYFTAELGLDCGDRIKGCTRYRGWVFGVDTRNGARLFDPVELPDYTSSAECHTNGPSTAVCLAAPGQPQKVWVVDLDHHEVTFTGPTDLSYQAGSPDVRVLGTKNGPTRLVVEVDGVGAYGLGPHAERTWFVPGNGAVEPDFNEIGTDVPPLAVAKQGGLRYGEPDRVFSVTDGHDLTPPPPPGPVPEQWKMAVAYNGGFAYAYDGGLTFYDTTGKRVAQQPLGTLPLPQRNPAMPTFYVGDHWEIYDAAGNLVTKIPATEDNVGDFRTIATKLYIKQGTAYDAAWQQWDLRTGQPGPTCNINLREEYIASDGTTILNESDANMGVRATDAATCQTLWETPRDQRIRILKISTGLLQHDWNANTIAWLRPPD